MSEYFDVALSYHLANDPYAFVFILLLSEGQGGNASKSFKQKAVLFLISGSTGRKSCFVFFKLCGLICLRNIAGVQYVSRRSI